MVSSSFCGLRINFTAIISLLDLHKIGERYMGLENPHNHDIMTSAFEQENQCILCTVYMPNILPYMSSYFA